MSTTFVIIPKDEEAKNGLLNLVGELEYFFPDQVKVQDALALETGDLDMALFLGMLRVQLEDKTFVNKAPDPADVWAPLSETESWPAMTPDYVVAASKDSKTIQEMLEMPMDVPKTILFCQECGISLSGMRRKFCSKSCTMKDYKRRHPNKKHRNNGNEGSDGSAAHPEPTGLPIAHTEDEISEFSPSWMNS